MPNIESAIKRVRTSEYRHWHGSRHEFLRCASDDVF